MADTTPEPAFRPISTLEITKVAEAAKLPIATVSRVLSAFQVIRGGKGWYA